MPKDAPETSEVQKLKSKLPIKTLIIILAIVLMEAGTITFFFVAKGTPDAAQATDPIAQTQELPNKTLAEVILAENTSVDNYIGGSTKIVVTFEVAAKVEADDKKPLEIKVNEHSKEILNSVRVVVSSVTPEQIKDPKLQVIKRELLAAIELTVGKELIKEILLPTWSTYTAD